MTRTASDPATSHRPSARFRDRPGPSPGFRVPPWAGFALLSGLYLTLRGYHAFDGDQAYRLPLLWHRLDPALYANDPFVAAFARFNPHRGYLALLAAASRPFGIAPALAALFALTMAATIAGLDRLARAAWPEAKSTGVGLVAVALVLLAKGGNIGTNHLFEATLLDRLVGFALGWLAIAAAIRDPARGWKVAAPLLGLAGLIHPSVGLQLALTLASGWVAWAVAPGPGRVDWASTLRAVAALALGQVPPLALMLGQGGTLLEGLPVEEFRQLAVLVQGPQHMLPSTWRTPQWLAWACYPALAALALGGDRGPGWPAGRARLAALLGVNLVSLGLAYVAVEWVGDLRATIFQPFRMATLARGLCLVAIAGRVVMLWRRGGFLDRGRAALIAAGLAGDWALVVASAVEATLAAADALGVSGRARWAVAAVVVGLGLGFLARHDTEAGQVGLIAALAALALGTRIARVRPMAWNRRRLAWAIGAAWAVPAAALVVPLAMADPGSHAWSLALVGRCRFAEVSTDDLERLGVWAREHTEPSARFVGPPGPKGFRLWSRRELAFNRAGSPYDARGLGDWAARYRDHVGFDGTTAEFVRAYLADRHALEARYQGKADAGKAELARRQGAGYVLAAAPAAGEAPGPAGPLELLRVEGRYAIYRVRPGVTSPAPGG